MLCAGGIMTGATVRARQTRALWQAADIATDGGWEIDLTDSQRDAIVAATRRLIASHDEQVDFADIDATSFPLEGMTDTIAGWTTELATGNGFLLIHGFPIDELNETETEIAYLGLGTHLGSPVGQNKAGELLTHIRDERLTDPTGARLYRTNKRQDFHTDGADIIGLLCLHRAARGGESRIVSTSAIHNAIAEQRPDLLEVLYQPMPWDRQGDQQDGEPPFFELAPFAQGPDGEARVFYIGWYIRDSQQHAEAPRLRADQLEAMAFIETLANDPAFHVEMHFAPGDVQLLNNARILHCREAYEDDADPNERRHLLRLWLAAHAFNSVDPVLRGGLGKAIS